MFDYHADFCENHVVAIKVGLRSQFDAEDTTQDTLIQRIFNGKKGELNDYDGRMKATINVQSFKSSCRPDIQR